MGFSHFDTINAQTKSLAKQHHFVRALRKSSWWFQFVAIMMGQASGRNSLRDMIDNLGAQAHRFYLLGSSNLSRSSLSRINIDKPYTLYEALLGELITRCQYNAQVMTFVSVIHFIHSMPARLICAYRYFHGRKFARPRQS
ncbi:MAG: DUF4372 domain-containing protein [Candidatus Thiodiazotropha taylori]|nr:DUF4372 domain-containing protein [Candidatus Thiodiazotropha taylori]